MERKKVEIDVKERKRKGCSPREDVGLRKALFLFSSHTVGGK